MVNCPTYASTDMPAPMQQQPNDEESGAVDSASEHESSSMDGSSGYRDRSASRRRLYLGNLPYAMTEGDIRKLFGDFPV